VTQRKIDPGADRATAALRAGLLPGYFVIALGGGSSHSATPSRALTQRGFGGAGG